MLKKRVDKMETEVCMINRLISNIRGRLNLHMSKMERLEDKVDHLISSYNSGMKMESNLAINVDMSELKQAEEQVGHLNELLREANALIGELATKKVRLDVYI